MAKCDPTSYSNPLLLTTTHIDIDWTIDFARTVLCGQVNLTLEAKEDDVQELVLDTKELNVTSVTHGGEALEFTFDEKHAAFGSALRIKLGNPVERNKKLTVCIKYETSSSATALQWLNPEQTAGKKYPYMFSQCQAIHARSILPCQDSPSVKTPYTAKVTAPEPIVVLMSALQCWEKSSKDERNEKVKTYKFEQKEPIPSYLIAIAGGLLESRQIGPRSKVWSEAQMVEAAAKEFADTEKMVAAGEALAGPYVWGQYDLLVLPPSFPYGGMENPCLTFVTPTLLAGDKSLANVVAHEIAHSWTGNLVTNHTWEHFWLNEGHTVFLERKISSRMFDEKTRQFEALGGLKSLQQSVDLFGEDSPLTRLVPDLEGVDPDDSFSSVPYEKGHTLLFYLESKLGGPSAFEPFLRSYIDRFKHGTVTTDQWKQHLYKFFANKKEVLDAVDWDAWLYKPGMPPVIPQYDQTMARECHSLCERWSQIKEKDFKSDDISKFSSAQKIEFLAQLLQKEPLTSERYLAMKKLYGFDRSGNSEIKFRWLRLGLRARCEDAIQPAITMATEQGRMKFTRPLYRDLGAWEASRPRAVDAFLLTRPSMHPTTAQLVAKDLKL